MRVPRARCASSSSNLKGKKKKSKESTDHERKWEQVAAARVLDPFLIPTYMPLAAVVRRCQISLNHRPAGTQTRRTFMLRPEHMVG